MSDRDLIEACAKAAGLSIARNRQAERDQMIGRENARLWIVGGSIAWSPVDDDADAFRLAVDLKLKIEHEQDHKGWYTVAWDGYFGSGKHYHDDTDRRTATRYAICTIAAQHERKAVGA